MVFSSFFLKEPARRIWTVGPVGPRDVGRRNIEAILGEAQGDRRTDTSRPAEDDGNFGAHGTSSSLPVVLRLSMSAWAFAASVMMAVSPSSSFLSGKAFLKADSAYAKFKAIFARYSSMGIALRSAIKSLPIRPTSVLNFWLSPVAKA
jgi:hypothetical protein